MANLSKEQVVEIIKNAPAGTSPQGIIDGLKKRGHVLEGYVEPKQEKETTGFFSGVAQDFGKRIENTRQALDITKRGEQTGGEFALQTLGQGAGVIGDVIGRGIGVAGKVASAVTPDFIEEPVVSAAKSAAGYAIEKAQPAFDAYGKFAEANPRAARNVEAVANIASSIPILKGGQVAAKVATPLVKAAAKEVPLLTKAAGRGIGGVVEKGGIAIQKSIIKPKNVDIRNGFKAENISKYGVGGALDSGLEATQSRLAGFVKQLNEAVTADQTPPNIRVGQVYDGLVGEATKAGPKTVGLRNDRIKALAEIESDLDSSMPNWREQPLNLLETIELKRAVGLKASFLHDPLKPNSVNAAEGVWNDFYRGLKKAAEENAPAGFEELNKAISELIPIEQAYIRRLNVAGNTNPLSLTDYIGLVGSAIEPSALFITAANRASKSGVLAKGLQTAGKALKGEKAITEIPLAPRPGVPPVVERSLPKAPRPLNAGENRTKISSWSELQKTNPDLFQKGILRKSYRPMDAAGEIPQDLHTLQGKWQNYGQYDEVPADVVYKRIESGSFNGEYEDVLGNPVHDSKTGNVLRDTYDDATGEWIKPSVSNQELRDSLLKQFETPEGKKYLKEVVNALPKNQDGTINAYRIGTTGQEGIQSYTLSEGMAKTFSNQGTDILPAGTPGLPTAGYKDFGHLPVNVVKIDPQGIKAWSPYDAEILVEPKFVRLDVVRKLPSGTTTQIKEKRSLTPKVTGENKIVGQKKITRITDFESNPNLSSIDKETEYKFKQHILKNEDSILAGHKEKYGNVVNTDEFRQYADDYVGHNSAAVQHGASYLAKRARAEALKNNPGEYLIAYAGGSGTGKTSAVKNMSKFDKLRENASVIADGNLSTESSALDLIDEAKAANKKPIFVYVYRDPVESLNEGIVPRMLRNKEERGRLVPNKVTAGNHIGSWETIQKIHTAGGKVFFVDNSLGKGNQKLVSFEELKQKIKYPTKHELTDIFNKESAKSLKNKVINPTQYKGYIE